MTIAGIAAFILGVIAGRAIARWLFRRDDKREIA